MRGRGEEGRSAVCGGDFVSLVLPFPRPRTRSCFRNAPASFRAQATGEAGRMSAGGGDPVVASASDGLHAPATFRTALRAGSEELG